MNALLITLLLAAGDSPPADLPACPSAEEKPAVAPLLQRVERLLEGKASVAVVAMTIKTPQYERTVKMKMWTRGRDFALVKVLQGGARETGMMTLKREKQLWNYLPQAGRVMKLPSGMLGDSWMGSDFTNDDLVRGSSIVEDFTSSVDQVVEHDGRSAWLITLTPKPSAKVVWGKVQLVLDRKSCVPLEQRFFDEDGKLARQLAYSDLKQLGWRTFPMKLTVTPAEKGRATTLAYDSMELDAEVPEDTFSLRRLQQGGD
jgi:hypothetical protein